MNEPLEYPWRKVIYSKVKAGTKRKFFILLECGHVHYHGDVPKVPKKKRCHYCAWGVKTIDVLFWEYDAIRWALRKLKEVCDNHKIWGGFTNNAD